jgi:glycosyltransferase domain-containing protein
MDLTLIIPTHERQYLIPRFVEYYSDFPCKKIIVDSSKDAILSSFPDFEYKHLPGFSFAEKILEGLYVTETEFVILSPDDDFLSFSAICEGIKFLKNNPNFSLVHGFYSVFYKDEKDIFRYFCKNFHYDCSVKYIDPISRLNYGMINYSNILYSLTKKNILLESVNQVSHFKEPTPVEISFFIVACICGFLGSVEKLWMYRDSRRYTVYCDEHGGNYFQNSISLADNNDHVTPVIVDFKNVLNSELGLIWAGKLQAFASKIIPEKPVDANLLGNAFDSYFNFLEKYQSGKLFLQSGGGFKNKFFNLFDKILWRLFGYKRNECFDDWKRIKSILIRSGY